MKSILVIDARPVTASLPRRILCRAGYLVDGARDGREAIGLARAHPPDLVYASRSATDRGDDPRALRALPDLADLPILSEVEAGAGRGPAVDALEPDETIATPVNPFELLAKVRFLIGDDGRRPPPRLAIRREAHVESGTIHALGALVNLSASGAFLETEAAGALADPVRLRFALPETEREVTATGRIVRRVALPGRPAGLAIQFVDLDPGARRDLEEFIFLRG